MLGSPSPSARFLSKCIDCSTQKIIHTVTHTLETFNFRQNCYIIDITSMPMYEGGVVYLIVESEERETVHPPEIYV